MKRLRGLLCHLCLLVASAPVAAGHGLMNAFGDIEWLPEPGLTPNDAGYRLDLWQERARLAMVSDGAERYALAVEFAREKLAEIDAVVRGGDSSRAGAAIAAYGAYLDTAAAAIATSAADQRAALVERYAQALLEQQYIVSVNYLDLPRASRGVIAEVIGNADGHYQALAGSFTRAFKESLFFKEEEVRWSWEMARQADLQGL